MRFAIIKVRDIGSTGRYEHILGTNSHDTLHVDEETGGLQYSNLQNMCGTKIYDSEKSEYEFIGKTEDWNPYTEVEFVDFDELLEIYKQNVKMSCEQERRTRDFMKKHIEKMRAEFDLDEDEGEISHTGGGSRY